MYIFDFELNDSLIKISIFIGLYSAKFLLTHKMNSILFIHSLIIFHIYFSFILQFHFNGSDFQGKVYQNLKPKIRQVIQKFRFRQIFYLLNQIVFYKYISKSLQIGKTNFFFKQKSFEPENVEKLKTNLLCKVNSKADDETKKKFSKNITLFTLCISLHGVINRFTFHIIMR